MRKIILLAIIATSLLLSSCLAMSVIYPVPLTNHTNDSILVFIAHCNNIDSVQRVLDSSDSSLRFNELGKVVYNENAVINPDAEGKYWVFGHRSLFSSIRSVGRQAFRHRNGYFFIIKLETARNYTWDEIRKNRLYDTLIVTRETFRENGWRIDYYGAVRE
jgi:hypothetical protein